ncbi:MAG: hypothetical protein K6E31_03385 [bacterium]|nr:hypothetical protein [bacterium]
MSNLRQRGEMPCRNKHSFCYGGSMKKHNVVFEASRCVLLQKIGFLPVRALKKNGNPSK